MKKRVLAMILAISLVLGLASGIVLADEEETEDEVTEESTEDVTEESTEEETEEITEDEDTVTAVSAVLSMSGSITLIQGIDSYEETFYQYEDEDGNAIYNEVYFQYYYEDLSSAFSDGDTITITYSDNSTKTYTYSLYGFYDEDENFLDYHIDSDQLCTDTNTGLFYANQWETGNSYTMKMILDEEDYVEVELTVSIVENPYVSAKFIPSQTITLIKGADSQTEYAEYVYDEEKDELYGVEGTEYEYYDLSWVDGFNDGDQIVIYDKEGNTYTYTYKTRAVSSSNGFYGEDGDYLGLNIYTEEDQESDPWEVGETHTFVLELYEYGQKAEVEVVIADEDTTRVKNSSSAAVSGSIDKYALAKALVGSVLTAEEYEQLIENDDIEPLILDVSDEGISKEDTAKVDEYIASSLSGYTTGLVLDITLWFNYYGDLRQITDTNGVPQTIEITIPDSLINTDSSVEREYRIIKVHDGAAEEVEATYDSETNTITFDAYEFSTYAIVYIDYDADTAKTGDTNNIALWICILAAAGLGLAGVGLRRKFN